jgi:hypothetical protein
MVDRESERLFAEYGVAVARDEGASGEERRYECVAFSVELKKPLAIRFLQIAASKNIPLFIARNDQRPA